MKRIIFLTALVLSVCVFASCGNQPPKGFVNPGDYLGGGGTGEVADSADDVTGGVKDDFSDEDFGGLSGNTSASGATAAQPTDGAYGISESGTYRFSGNYGGIVLEAANLDLHLIFDGAHVERADGIALDGSAKKGATVVVTLIGDNSIVCTADGQNAVHVKGTLSFNGSGSLSVQSGGKNAVKVSKGLTVVDCSLTLSAANHAISALSVSASNCKINVESAGKDGINAECDDETTAFTTEEGYVYLKNVEYSCQTEGDGIQADTVVYIDGGNYNIKTAGTFVPKTQMTQYGIDADDFKYIKSGTDYKRIASDEAGRYGASSIYGLVQGCKGIKVGEIEYPVDGSDEEITVYEGNYSIIIDGGTFVIDSTDDAVHANSGNLSVRGGTFTISTYDDALTSDVLTKITDGEITVTSSYEGIEGGYVEITGGKIDVTSSDDGINAASDDVAVTEHIIISGGDITVNAEGDGVDSNGSINMTGGRLTVFGPTSGANAALDADRGILVDGGYLFAAGPLGMVETPAGNSKQNVLSFAQNQAITAGTVLSLSGADGTPFISVTVKKNCQSVIVSCPELVTGSSFTLYGGSTQLCTFTVSSVITSVGSSGGMGGGMGGPGGTRPGGPGGRW